jgi:hypothetical protein
MPRKRLYILLAASFAFVILVIWGIVALFLLTGGGNEGEQPTPSTSSSAPEQGERTISGLSADEDRQAAVAATQVLLNSTLKLPEGVELDALLDEINGGDLTRIPAEVTTGIRFTDQFAESQDAQAGAYQTLYALSFLVWNNAGGEGEIKPVTDTAWKSVLVDQEVGLAYVPLSIFTGTPSGFSLEMVYLDGKWQLSPYSLVEAVRLSASLASAAETPQ